MQNLLRIAILILVGMIAVNIAKQSGFFGSMGGLSGNRSAEIDPTQEQIYGAQANLDAGPQYDVDAGSNVAPRPHETGDSQLFETPNQVLPYPQIATSPQDSYYLSGGVCSPNDPGCYAGSVLQAPDLLPADSCDNAWCDTSPQSQGHISDQNFLESGHHYGINTVGQSLKNANRQLRSDPPIPKVNIGPWSNSTISADGNRKGFEIEA